MSDTLQYVWMIHTKVWMQICATEEDAHKLIADLGMNTPSLYPPVSKVPVWRYDESVQS